MNILIQTDNNYAEITTVMLHSLFINNKNEDMDVYLLHSNLDKKYIDTLEKQCISDSSETSYRNLHPISVDGNLFKKYNMRSDITNTAFYKLIAYMYLPKKVDKILYLDSDLIVKNSLQELYDLQFDKNTMFYAGSECQTSQKEFTRLGFDFKKILNSRNVIYVNSGVLLINVKMMRKAVSVDDIIEFIESHKDKMIYKDQDVINGMFFLFIKYFNAIKYNFINFSFYFDERTLNFVKQACITHFAGPNQHKPWCEEFWGYDYVYEMYKKYALGSVVSETMEEKLKIVCANLKDNQSRKIQNIKNLRNG